LLPPARDPGVFNEFTYRVTFCNHAELAALESFVLSLPQAGSEPVSAVPDDATAAPPGTDPFPGIFDGLMRNRGLGARNIPFTGLSRSTIHGMVSGRWYSVHPAQRYGRPAGVDVRGPDRRCWPAAG
jgi:hypothetical protein